MKVRVIDEQTGTYIVRHSDPSLYETCLSPEHATVFTLEEGLAFINRWTAWKKGHWQNHRPYDEKSYEPYSELVKRQFFSMCLA